MENSYSSYIKQVERALNLPQSQKKELLQGFQAEIKEKFPDPPSSERLLNDMGQPEEVAFELLEAVDPKEYIRFNSTRFRRFRIVVVTLALLMMISIGTIIYLDASELKRVDVNIVQDPIPTQRRVCLFSFFIDGGGPSIYKNRDYFPPGPQAPRCRNATVMPRLRL
ncbi:MAG: hypothetical protein HFF19_10475 [Oscillospiraceae bacterium]|nr:hypothetical protein [Oscillospiraceae bacterium]